MIALLEINVSCGAQRVAVALYVSANMRVVHNYCYFVE